MDCLRDIRFRDLRFDAQVTENYNDKMRFASSIINFGVKSLPISAATSEILNDFMLKWIKSFAQVKLRVNCNLFNYIYGIVIDSSPHYRHYCESSICRLLELVTRYAHSESIVIN